MKKAERKQQILQGAARLFSSRRFDEVTMDDIAQEAGVAKGTLYGHFPDKEELYFAVIFNGVSNLNEQMQVKGCKDQEPEKQLRNMLQALVSFLTQNGYFFKLMSIEDSKSDTGEGENRQRWREERHKQLQIIEDVLSRGGDQGIFEIRNLKVEARILRDMVRSVLLSADEDMSVGEMVELIMRVFLLGVKKTA